MMNNYPPGAENDSNAPYNEHTKLIDVDISVSLSSHRKIRVPADFDETDNIALEQIVQEKIIMPQDYAEIYEDYSWIVDELCVL